jgi:cholesterol transport system auxiliary component
VLLVVLIVPLLGGCMLARSGGSVSIISPQVDMAIDEDWPEVEWSVLVQRPVADQMRNSDRILVRVSRSRLQSWPDAAWLDSMPDMVHGLLIQSLEDSGRFAGVGRAGGLRSRFGLVSELRRFEVVDDGRGSLTVELGLRANLVHQPTGRVMATESFDQAVAVSGTSLDAIIEAFEEAMAGLFAEVTGWVLVSGREAREEREERDGWRDRFTAPEDRRRRGG